MLTESEGVSGFVEKLDGALAPFEDDVVEPEVSVVAGGVTAVGAVTDVVFVFVEFVRAGDVEALELVVALLEVLG